MRKRVLNKIVYVAVVLCMVITILYCPTDVYAATGSVTFGSESYETQNNSQFQIGVYLKTESKMGSYHVELEYDNSRIDYMGGADSEENGVITLEGVGVSNEIKYMLSFESKSGGDAYIKVKNAVIYTSQAGSTEQFDVTNLSEAPIKISGEDTGAPRQDEQQQQYVGPFETTVPHLEPAIKMNNTDYYVVDSNQYVPDSVKWKYTLVPGKLGDMDVTFLSNGANDIYFLTLVDANSETHLYSYSNTKKQLFECDFYNSKDKIYYYTSPYACDKWPNGLTSVIAERQNVCYALSDDGTTGFYEVESGELKPWSVDEEFEDAKQLNVKKIIVLIIMILLVFIVLFALCFMLKEIFRNERRKKNYIQKRKLDYIEDPYAPEFELDEEEESDEKQHQNDAAVKNPDEPARKNNAEVVEGKQENKTEQQPIISVQDVTMRFKISNSSASGIKDFFIQKLKHQITYRELYALDHVSFDVFKGEVVGLIGTNGSGKSTMLRIVSGALNPTSGKVDVDRRKVQLLTLGTGFDMELTARENIYLNGAIIGYSKKFIEEHFDEILDFAELHDFVDEKVKNFSSGMVSRLGFAIATAGDAAEILILDEVLSVGDEFFRKKSLARVKEMIHGGSTVLMVSHGMGTILENCSKVVWIEKGKLQMVGDPKTVCAAYRKQQNV